MTQTKSKNSKNMKLQQGNNNKKRDKQGRFAYQEGGLASVKRYKWSRILPVIVVVALIGGVSVYRSRASGALLAAPGTQSGEKDCQNATGVITKETSGNKRNVSVCQLSVNKVISPIIFGDNRSSSSTISQFNGLVNDRMRETGYYKTCYNVRRTGSGQATVSFGGYATNSSPGAGTQQVITNTNYQTVCDPIVHRAGTIRPFLRVQGGTVRISSIGLTQATNPQTTSRITIATLGDSNTANRNWRNVYQNRLKSSGCSYDMVGQFGNESWLDRNYDWNTDAKGGAAIKASDPALDIFRLGSTTVRSSPDIIFIIAGTNNVSWGESLWNNDTIETFLGRHISNLETEINTVTTTSPDSLVLLGAIPHSNLSPNFVPRYNLMQKQMVERMQRNSKNIEFWDAQTNTGDIQSDGVHLNSSGEEKYGNAAYRVSQSYMLNSGACN